MSETNLAEPLAPPEAPLIDSDRIIQLSTIAQTVHEEWLAATDRTYSPFNKPWDDLSPAARAHIGRQAFRLLELVSERYPEIVWEDDLGAASPPDVVPEIEDAKDEVEVVE